MDYTIQTPCGTLKGFCKDDICRYLGIRYATAGRFEYPQEVTAWEGIYEALAYGPAPIQLRAYSGGMHNTSSSFYHREFMDGVHSEYSEDCLFLNIWTPRDAKNCPVMIVIYGGGLTSGQSNEAEFDGAAYAKRDVILVSFNYRVNIFGFCALPELKDSRGRTGNYGYYDQQMAFQWVLHNIRAFGGDPTRMTLIGQSAGATGVETQIKSPLNAGLFRGAIIQSSAGFTTKLKAKDNRARCYALWQKVYEKAGCDNIEQFKTMPAEQLFNAWYSLAKNNMIQYSTVVYDEDFSSPLKNKPCATDIICGFTAQDTMPIIFYALCRALAKSQSGTAVTYTYLFRRKLPGDNLGAWHSSDLRYVYGTLAGSWRPFTDEDYFLSATMTDYFANFAKTGNPNGEGLKQWQPYTREEHRFMVFDTGDCKMGKPNALRLLWETLFYKGPRG